MNLYSKEPNSLVLTLIKELALHSLEVSTASIVSLLSVEVLLAALESAISAVALVSTSAALEASAVALGCLRPWLIASGTATLVAASLASLVRHLRSWLVTTRLLRSGESGLSLGELLEFGRYRLKS